MADVKKFPERFTLGISLALLLSVTVGENLLRIGYLDVGKFDISTQEQTTVNKFIGIIRHYDIMALYLPGRMNGIHRLERELENNSLSFKVKYAPRYYWPGRLLFMYRNDKVTVTGLIESTKTGEQHLACDFRLPSNATFTLVVVKFTRDIEQLPGKVGQLVTLINSIQYEFGMDHAIAVMGTTYDGFIRISNPFLDRTDRMSVLKPRLTVNAHVFGTMWNALVSDSGKRVFDFARICSLYKTEKYARLEFLIDSDKLDVSTQSASTADQYWSATNTSRMHYLSSPSISQASSVSAFGRGRGWSYTHSEHSPAIQQPSMSNRHRLAAEYTRHQGALKRLHADSYDTGPVQLKPVAFHQHPITQAHQQQVWHYGAGGEPIVHPSRVEVSQHNVHPQANTRHGVQSNTNPTAKHSHGSSNTFSKRGTVTSHVYTLVDEKAAHWTHTTPSEARVPMALSSVRNQAVQLRSPPTSQPSSASIGEYRVTAPSVRIRGLTTSHQQNQRSFRAAAGTDFNGLLHNARVLESTRAMSPDLPKSDTREWDDGILQFGELLTDNVDYTPDQTIADSALLCCDELLEQTENGPEQGELNSSPTSPIYSQHSSQHTNELARHSHQATDEAEIQELRDSAHYLLRQEQWPEAIEQHQEQEERIGQRFGQDDVRVENLSPEEGQREDDDALISSWLN